MLRDFIGIRVNRAKNFFFNDTATTEIYTLSLHDALPIFRDAGVHRDCADPPGPLAQQVRVIQHGSGAHGVAREQDRKSTRLNSSHLVISYAVFCLKKKKNSCYRYSNNPESNA